jgi:hypothetical protein
MLNMEQKIEIINNWNLKRVFDELEQGNIKIPKFQRAYVWERQKVVKLLNSIYKQYPIGSFFFWVAPKEYVHFCREIEELDFKENPDANFYSFILDGQQRSTSLYVALKGKKLNNTDYSTICFNLEKKQFQIPRLKNEKHNIPAWKLFDSLEFANTLRDYTLTDYESHTNFATTWMECQQAFSDYPISVIKSLKMDLDEVVEIFEKINQGGKRLSLFDLVHASAWSTDFDLREKIRKFNSDKVIKIYGEIGNEIFTQSLTLNKFDDCLQKTQLKLTAEIGKAYWSETSECIKLAIDFLKTFGVKNSSFLPYNSIIPIVQYYFFKSQRKSVAAAHFTHIRNWFWSTTFSQRYSSSSLTKMKEDAEWIKSISEDILTENVYPVTLTIKELLKIQMRTASVVKNGVLCLMALNNPKDFDNSQSVSLDNTHISRLNSKENHHIFPYSLRKEFGVDNEINSLMNFALITSRLNREISNDYPAEYFERYGKLNRRIIEDLASHFITDDAILAIKGNRFEMFVNARANEIINSIKTVTGLATNETLEKEIIEGNIEFDEEVLNEQP